MKTSFNTYASGKLANKLKVFYNFVLTSVQSYIATIYVVYQHF